MGKPHGLTKRGVGKPGQLDGEAIFKKKFVEMGASGSWDKVCRWYNREFGRNHETGNEFRRESMDAAAWRWAYNNLEEAERIYTRFCIENYPTDEIYGKFSHEDWLNTVASRVDNILKSKSATTKFFNQNPEYAKYRKLKK